MRMTSVTISPKYQVVIPKRIRESLRLRPGQKLSAVAYGGHIHLVPIVPLQNIQGMLKGIDTTVVREPDREL